MSHNLTSVNANDPDRDGDITAGASAKVIAYGRGESDAYSNSAATGWSVGDEVYFYDSSPTDSINATALSAGWRSDFTLPAGKYIIKWQYHVEDTGSGWYLVIGLYNGTTRLGANYIGETSAAQTSNGLGQAFINTASAVTLTFKVVNSSSIDTVANQSTTPSQYSAFYVMEVS
jgi:hypothetical protein